MKHPQTTWWIIIVLVNQISYSQVQGNVECTEDVNKTVKITPAHHENNPRRPWEQFYVPESQESIIDDVKITCQNVSFPLQYQASTSCNNCPHILKIVSLNIGIVPPAAFFHVSDFSVLILNSLNISEILPGAFGQQPLKELYLSGNRLSEVGLAVFNSLIKLEVLDLSNNKIKTLPAHCLTGMINLKTLKLSNNNLSTFLFDVLDPNVKQISSLDLSSNIISKFVMKDGIAIANISLNNNKLTSIEFCPLMFSSLSVQNNLLKHLPFSDCNNTVNKLKYFDVSFNSINDIDTFYFENSSNLEYLYLNNNNITNIPAGVFYNLNNLKSLNLSYNNLQKFQYGTFDSLKNLTILDISNNNFVSINRSLHSVNTLEELYIQNNKISYINSKQFLKDFPKLGKICFDNNKLTCDDVIETVRDFKDVLILHYNLRNASNVYGISCSETVASTDASITEKVETETEDNNDHRGTIKNYFENSSFLTFLEKLEKQNSLKFNETQIFKYFNEEFEKSKFYKYLESLKSDHNVTDLHNQYLLNRSVNLNSEQNFQSSELYKYLESLRQAESLRSETNPETEKLISVEKTGYDKMVTILSLNAVFVLLMCFISLSISIFLYKNVFRNKSNTREQVELLGN